MKIFKTVTRAALAGSLLAAVLTTAHATFPGENGVIVYTYGYSVTRVNADGGGLKTLAISATREFAVSPNGKWIAYVGPKEGAGKSIRVMNIDGSNDMLVADEGYMPFWKADGYTLGYLHDRNHYNDYGQRFTRAHVVLVDMRTLTVNQTNQILSAQSKQRFDPSPIGEGFAVDLGHHGFWLNDTGIVNLPSMYLASTHPDGRTLVGAIGDAYGYTNPLIDCIHSMRRNGSERKKLTCSGSWGTVSPDGKQLLASRPVDAGIYLSPMDGGPERFLGYGYRTAWSRVPMTAMHTKLDSGTWSAPAALANDSDTYTAQSAIAVMPDDGVNGTLRRAVGVGPDGRVYERAQGVNNAWSAWTLVPGMIGKTADGVLAKRVAIAGAQDGSVQMAIVADDDLVYHASRRANGTWSGFAKLDGTAGAPQYAARDVAIAIADSSYNSPGTAHVVANGLDVGAVHHRVRWADGSWTPWGWVATQPWQTGTVAVAAAANGDAYVLATTAQGIVSSRRLANGKWDKGVSISQVPVGALKSVSLAIQGDGGLSSDAHVSFIDSDGRVWFRSIRQPQLGASWSDPVGRFGVVMEKGRDVSVGHSPVTGAELLVVQAQPQ